MASFSRSEMFRNAHLNINGGNITQVTGHQINYHGHDSPEVHKQKALKRLFKHIAEGAFHDSAVRRDPPKCHPHTREAVIHDILKWARNPSNQRLIMWIYGPAGAGKSAIMQTIAELCDELNILGGSFFFFRSAERRNITDHLIFTLAYQLAKRVPYFEDHLVATILDDPAVFSRNMEKQMKALILDPMATAAAEDPNSSQHFYVILVDGLDECRLESSQRETINLLSSSASTHLRFIIASRRELAIRDSFSIPYILNQTQTLALDDNYHPDDDIRRFLEDKFRNIKTSHILRHSLPPNWPGNNVMDTLIRNSSGQFIYAATVMRYIESARHSPIEHLATALKAHLSPEQSEAPFVLLDALYHQIFAAVADVTLPAVLNIFRVLLSDLNFITTFWIEKLLGYSSGKARLILCDMHSLVRIDEDLHELNPKNTTIKLHHKSLEDFLSDPLRSKDLYINLKEARQLVFINFLSHFDVLLQCHLCDDHDPQDLWEDLKTMFSAWNLSLTTELSDTLLRSIPSISKASFEYELDHWGAPYVAMDKYYRWVDNQCSSNPLVTQLYNSSLNWLDDQISGIISQQEQHPPLLVIWTYALKLSLKGMLEDLIPSQWFQDDYCFDADGPLILDLEKLTTGPSKTKQILDTLCDREILSIIIKYSFSRGCIRRDSIVSEWDHQDATLIQFIIEYLPHFAADPDIGKEISGATVTDDSKDRNDCEGPPKIYIHYEECPIGSSLCSDYYGMCLEYRKYCAQLHFKQLRYEFSAVCLDYLQRCGVYIEAHEYTNTHYLCFACQSTEAFLEDSRYFEVQKMQFSIREEAEDDECMQDIEYGEDKEYDENDENEMF